MEEDDDPGATAAARAFIAYVGMKETQSYIDRGQALKEPPLKR